MGLYGWYVECRSVRIYVVEVVTCEKRQKQAVAEKTVLRIMVQGMEHKGDDPWTKNRRRHSVLRKPPPIERGSQFPVSGHNGIKPPLLGTSSIQRLIRHPRPTSRRRPCGCIHVGNKQAVTSDLFRRAKHHGQPRKGRRTRKCSLLTCCVAAHPAARTAPSPPRKRHRSRWRGHLEAVSKQCRAPGCSLARGG